VFYGPSIENRPVETKTAAQFIDLSSTAGALPHLQAVYVDRTTHSPTPITVVSGTVAVPSTTVTQVTPSVSVIHSAPFLTGPHTVTTSTYVPNYFTPPHDVLPVGDLSPVVAAAEHSEDLSSAESDSSGTDSDLESDMADINPTTFSGIASENAEVWMRYFFNFCEFRAHTEPKMLALFKVLIVGSVATWLDSLTDDICNNWDALKDAFLHDRRVLELQKCTRIV